jgi:pimeloyl-ACP methyl ester carboxylesterase
VDLVIRTLSFYASLYETATSFYSILFPSRKSTSDVLKPLRIAIKFDSTGSEEYVTTTFMQMKTHLLTAPASNVKLPPILSFPLPPLPPPATNVVDYIFFFVPGNLGSAIFYESFITYMNNLMAKHSVVFIVPSLAGHSIVSPHSSIITVQNSYCEAAKEPSASSERLYSLEDQISIMKGILQYQMNAHPKARVILGGHSIGAYITSHLAPMVPKDQLVHILFVCPALMEMANTPNGRRLAPLVIYGRSLMACLFSILGKLPLFIRSILTLIYTRLSMHNSANDDHQLDSECIIRGSLDINSGIAHQVLYMTLTEMDDVKALKHQLFRQFSSQLTMYFSCADDWCPQTYVREIRESLPDATVTLFPPVVPHAFVLGTCKLVATLLWNRIAPLLETEHVSKRKR